MLDYPLGPPVILRRTHQRKIDFYYLLNTLTHEWPFCCVISLLYFNVQFTKNVLQLFKKNLGIFVRGRKSLSVAFSLEV
jgi:hypothetical protein